MLGAFFAGSGFCSAVLGALVSALVSGIGSDGGITVPIILVQLGYETYIESSSFSQPLTHDLQDFLNVIREL